MSTNNLREQLAWLLNVKPFVPPLCTSTAPPDDGLAASIEVDDQPDIISDQDLLQHDSSGDTNSKEYTTVQQEQVEAGGGPMARLRTNPSPTKKPRLVTQPTIPDTTIQRSVSRSRSNSVSKHGQGRCLWPTSMPPTVDFHAPLKINQEARTTPQSPPSKTFKTPSTCIEEIDLTGDDSGEVKAPAKQLNVARDDIDSTPSKIAGRKRKSDEYEADLGRRQKSSPSKPRMNGGARRARSPGITSVERRPHANRGIAEEDRLPAEPPPPYSTEAPAPTEQSPSSTARQQSRPAPLRSKPGHATSANLSYSTYYSQSISDHDDSRESEGNATPQQSLPNKQRSRHTPQRGIIAPSEIESNRPKANTPSKLRYVHQRQGSPSPVKQQPFSVNAIRHAPPNARLAQQMVADSEQDDDLDANVETQKDTPSPLKQPPHRDRMPVKPPPSSDVKQGVTLPPAASNGDASALPSSDAIKPDLQASKVPRRAELEVPSIKQTTSSPIHDGQSDTGHGSVDIPEVFADTDTIVVLKDSAPLIRGFAQWSIEDLDQYVSQTNNDLTRVAEEFTDALEDGEDTSDLVARRDQLIARKEAVHSLQEARQHLCQVSSYRDSILRQTRTILMTGGNPDADLSTLMRTLKEKSRKAEDKVVELIEAAKIEVAPIPPPTEKIAVKSTQLPSKNESATQRIPDSSICQTQFVQQTQHPPIKQGLSSSPRKPSLEQHLVHPPARDDLRGESSCYFLPPASDWINDFDEENFGMDDDMDSHMMDIAIDYRQQHSAKRSAPDREVLAERPSNITDKPPPAYPWAHEVKQVLTQTFLLKGFRPNQLNAINATLAGNDAFVLMPTGGGKSLCYQLPATICSGYRKGVTVVVSPLLSLMQDQLQHLERLNIQVAILNGEKGQADRQSIYKALDQAAPEDSMRLLYVTPEMLSKSNKLVSKLKALNKRRKLARLVIDEAHCVSQWGHDFRPDYKNIGEVRAQLGDVPLMALTATATENVKVDVMHNLKMNNCKVFTQSFNRPNLFYEVRKKGRGIDILEDMASTIKESYKNSTGIIYCLSRKQCEEVAKKLRSQHGIKAHHYHAHLTPEEKVDVQTRWQSGSYRVIVATIAFGMGIDKPDVRFVMHHSLPKSLEGYYQETGRAGRDGKPSVCHLYYGYQDVASLKRMIEDGEGSREQIERQLSMLRRMIAYCENRMDCRRCQVLHYFSEPFKKKDCNASCDNCTSASTFETRDFTDYAVSALRLVRRMQNDRATILQCIDAFRGAKNKKVADHHWDDLGEYGAGAELSRTESERLFYYLLSENAIVEVNETNKRGFAQQHVSLGPNCAGFTAKRRRVLLQVRIDTSEKPKKKKKDAIAPSHKKSRAALEPSTMISSPMQAPAKRRAKAIDPDEYGSDNNFEMMGPRQHKRSKAYEQDDFRVPDDEMDDDDIGFAPVREGVSRKQTTCVSDLISDPITRDKLDSLEASHRQTVLEFRDEAQRLCTKLVSQKNLHRRPFSQTNFVDMAILFPKSKREMLDYIDDLDERKVEAYGEDFLKLLRKYAKINDERRRASDQNRPVYDKNRQIVDLVDDDTESLLPGDSGDEDQEPHRSDYFSQGQGRPQNARASAFLNQSYEHSQQAAVPSRYGSKAPSKGKKNSWRGRSEGSRRGDSGPKSDAGVKKSRKPSYAPARKGSTSNNTGPKPASRQPSMGAGGQRKLAQKTGGIGMMPV